METSIYTVQYYIIKLLDEWTDWNCNIFVDDCNLSCANIRSVLQDGSDGRTRAAEAYRFGLLKFKLSQNITVNSLESFHSNPQSDLGFIAALLIRGYKRDIKDTSIKRSLGALSAIFSVMQSVTIGDLSISINYIIHRLIETFPIPNGYDKITWTKYLLAAFFCETVDKQNLQNLYNYMIGIKNTIELRLINLEKNSSGIIVRASFKNSDELSAIIDRKIDLNGIYHQRRHRFIANDEGTDEHRGSYRWGEIYFTDFLNLCYKYEKKNHSMFEPLFDNAISSSKGDALSFLKNICSTEDRHDLKEQFGSLMKTIEEGAISALSKLMDKPESEYEQYWSHLYYDDIDKYDTSQLQKIYFGAPGTGKSNKINSEIDNSRTLRITFHPETSYADFIGAYKPLMKPTRINCIEDGKVYHADPIKEHPGTEDKIAYSFTPQAFLNAYVAAWKDLNHKWYLVIEEINRGNCARIFGDIFQLLDRPQGFSSYPIVPDNDISNYLKSKEAFGCLTEETRSKIVNYDPRILSGEVMSLPPNLHIWATMNTSDQSLYPMDAAFKRRWEWIYIPIEYKPDKKDWEFQIGIELFNWGKFLQAINKKITEVTGSTDKQIGYFFISPDLNRNIISKNRFLNKFIFYIFNDVFKNFINNSDDEIFINEVSKNKIPYSFIDFFENEALLTNFVKKVLKYADTN